jgi:hypothetical protein
LAKPLSVLLIAIGIAVIAAAVLFPLAPCPGADSLTRFQCHVHGIESLIITWSVILLIALIVSSFLHQLTLIRSRRRSVFIASACFFGTSAVGVLALVASGFGANTFGETRGIYLFYGDAGMGLWILTLLESVFAALAVVCSIAVFAVVGHRSAAQAKG